MGSKGRMKKLLFFFVDTDSGILPDRAAYTGGGAFLHYRKDERNGKDRSGRRECGVGRFRKTKRELRLSFFLRLFSVDLSFALLLH